MPTGYIYEWTGARSTNFATAGNWFNQTVGSTATLVPGISDEAIIDASGAVTGTSNVYSLSITGTGWGLNINGQLGGEFIALNDIVAINVGDSITGLAGPDPLSGVVEIAKNASALVQVNAGGTLTAQLAATDGVSVLVGENGYSGALDVAGKGALASSGPDGFDVGYGGIGDIAVSNGGSIGGGSAVLNSVSMALGLPGGTGTLSITGAGSTGTFADRVEVGFGGTGTLLVQSGAGISAGDGTDSLSIGDNDGGATGNGVATISGATAVLDGVAGIGAYGTGSLVVTNGASVQLNSPATDGESAYWSMLVAESVGSSGTVMVTGLSQLVTQHGVGIGADGSGLLDVYYSDLVINTTPDIHSVALDIGLQAGASGVVQVAYGVIQDVNASGVLVGGYGNGVLTISTGGTVICGGSSGANAFAIAGFSGSNGSLTVSGTGALLSAAGQISDGTAGGGSVLVSAGGSIAVSAPTDGAGLVLGATSGSGVFTENGASHVSINGQVEVGGSANGTMSISGASTLTALSTTTAALELSANGGASTLTVTDPGTLLFTNGGLAIGGFGTGSFTLENSAHILTDSPNGALPGFVMSVGTLTSTGLITGLGTQLSDFGQFLVGGQGAGTLTIAAGASVGVLMPTAQNYLPAAVIGANASTNTGTSIVNVTGTDSGTASSWSIGGELIVGHLSAGTLNISAGGFVNASTVILSDLNGGQGLINVTGAGSTLMTTALSIGTPQTTGSLTVQSGGLVSVNGTVSINGTASLSGGTLTATGVLAIGGGSSVTGNGVLSAGSLVDLGQIAVSSGTLSCLGTITGSGSLSIAHGGLLLQSGEAAGVGLNFGAAGSLTTASAASIAGLINGWQVNDVIDLTTIKIASDSFSNGTLSLYDSSKHLLGTLHFGGSLVTHNFTLATDGGNGTLIKFHA